MTPATFAALFDDGVTQITLKSAPTSYHDIAATELYGWPLTASSFYPPRGDLGMGVRHAPEFAVDGDPESTWSFDCRAGNSAWLEVDLGQACRLGAVEIREAHGRVRAFRIQAKQEDRWETIHEGGTIGEDYRATFAPRTARFVRLEVLKVGAGPCIGPQIGEFHLYSGEERPPAHEESSTD